MLKVWRWAVFLLALGYTIYQVQNVPAGEFGSAFRFLTNWGLAGSLLCASAALALTLGLTKRRAPVLMAVVAVLNVLVVLLYWRLYFADPASVTRDGQLMALWLELYLHGAGPALQIIEALFLSRAFRRPVVSIAALAVTFGAYVAWMEFVLRPLSDSPVGRVTSGLPYPFLNNLELAGRMTFYGSNVVVAFVVLALFFALQWGVKRALPRHML